MAKVHFKVKRDHYTTGAGYKAGDVREMDESDAAPLVSLGVLEQTAAPKGRSKSDSAE